MRNLPHFLISSRKGSTTSLGPPQSYGEVLGWGRTGRRRVSSEPLHPTRHRPHVLPLRRQWSYCPESHLFSRPGKRSLPANFLQSCGTQTKELALCRKGKSALNPTQVLEMVDGKRSLYLGNEWKESRMYFPERTGASPEWKEQRSKRSAANSQV